MTEPPDEVERLRARVRELEEQAAARGAGTEAPAPPRRERQWWRSVLVVVLVTVGAVLAPLTVIATWAHDEIGDTDRFQEAVTPLATDPAVQAAIADRITDEIDRFIDVREITGQALTALSRQDFIPPRIAGILPSLSVPLSTAIQGFVQARVEQVVASETFEQAWVAATRQAHAQMVAVLTGETSEAVDTTDGAVTINIASLVASVKQVLIDDGFSFASRIPEVNASFTIFQADNLGRAQQWFGWLDTLARALPVLSLLLLFTAVLVARNRRKALLAVGLVVAGSMVLLGLGLDVVRPIYLGAVPEDVLPNDAAAAIYDELISFVRTSLRAVGIVFLALAAAAFWFAPTGAGAALRTGSAGGLSRLRSSTGFSAGPVGRFLGTYRTFARVSVLVLGTLAYLALDHPTGRDAALIIVGVVLVLVVLEFVAGPPEAALDAR